MATLTTQTAKINAIISLKDLDKSRIDSILEDLKKWCEQSTNLYAFILHNKDVLENGEIKTPHIHLVAIMKSNRKRLSTTLSDIAEFIDVNTLAISIDKMSDIVGSLQYLIHKNNPDKHHYEERDIITNISQGEMSTYMASDCKSMSIEYLVGVIEKHRSKIDIMREIGLTYYHLYRNTINDIYKEVWE